MSKTQTDNIELEMLRGNIKDQINRLFDQLEDLDLLKDELTEQEYTDEYNDTINELEDFNKFLESSLSLSTEFNLAQQAMKAALDGMRSAATNGGSTTADNRNLFRLLATADVKSNKNDQLISKFMELDLTNTTIENNNKMNELITTLSSEVQNK